MKLLVTGGAGFIGSNFIHYWRNQHPQDAIVNLDSLTYAGNLMNLDALKNDPNHHFIKGDITSPDAVSHAMKGCEVVVHFAAESFVDRSIAGPGPFVTTNIVGSQILFDAAMEQGIRRFIHVSTDEVYGSLGKTGQFTEHSPFKPNNPYAASKAAADLLALSYFKTFSFPVIITHCSNNYGPYQFPEKFLPLFILRAMKQQELPIYGDGLNVRDWIHVNDHCRGIDLALQKGVIGETYNLGGDQERSNLELAKQICSLTDCPESCFRFVKDRPGHDFRYAVDFSKSAAELGFAPTHIIEDDLVDMVQWYRTNKDWSEKILSGAYQEFYETWYQKERGLD